jgi:Domain of unknown function (DUF4136)
MFDSRFPARRHEMSKRLVGTLATVALCSVALHAGEKVKVDWDQSADFSKFHTYSWAEMPTTARPMLALEIRGSIDQELTNRGLKETKSGGDLIVSIHGSADSDVELPVSDPTYAATGGVPLPDATVWSPSGAGGSRMISKGTLVVDLVDSSSHRPVWRGTASGALKTKSSALQKQVHKSVAEMFKDFPPQKEVSH